MNGYRKTSAAAQRFAERRQREDEAPRLEQEFPELVSLRLTIEEKSAGVAASVPKYSRHIMVATAPALFLIACGDRRCVDGGHDITTEVMSGLRAHQTHFEGEHACSGTLGSAACARIIGFIAEAEYRTG